MPTFKIRMLRRRSVEQEGTLTLEAPTLGDAYQMAAFDLTAEDVRKRTAWEGKPKPLADDMFVKGERDAEDDGG